MTIPLLVVGEDHGVYPGTPRTDKYALTGRGASRYVGYAGITLFRWDRLTRRTNLVRHPDDWSDADKRHAGRERVRELMADADRVVVLGQRAADALGIGRWPLYRFAPYPARLPFVHLMAHVIHGTDTGARPLVARAPHPSGRNRHWNDPANVVDARRFWQSLLASLEEEE